jgi:hypothetical protein
MSDEPAVVIEIKHHRGEPPADAPEIGRWRYDSIDGGPLLIATLGEPPVVNVWWSEPPRRGEIEAWYRAEVQPAITAALLNQCRGVLDANYTALVITPTAAELARARAEKN